MYSSSVGVGTVHISPGRDMNGVNAQASVVRMFTAGLEPVLC